MIIPWQGCHPFLAQPAKFRNYTVGQSSRVEYGFLRVKYNFRTYLRNKGESDKLNLAKTRRPSPGLAAFQNEDLVPLGMLSSPSSRASYG
jgi:hypothetical protein